MRLNADAREAELFALYDGGAGAAERIKHPRAPPQTELLHIFADQMRRVGEHEAVPVVRWPVGTLQTVCFRPIAATGGALSRLGGLDFGCGGHRL